MSLLRRFWRDTGGNMVTLSAMGLSMLVLVAAIAIDGAALYNEKRSLQNGVDLAALSAASDPAQALKHAQAALVEAGLLASGSTAGLTVTTGRYDPNPAKPAAARFVAGQTPANAVAVRLERQGMLHLAQGWADPPMLGASATATTTPQVAFSVGSRLASLNGGIVNGVLNSLLGSSVSLTLLDYQSLLGVNVDLLPFLDALAIEMNLKVGTYDDLLALKPRHGQLAKVLAGLVGGTARTVLLKLANSTTSNGQVNLHDVFNLGDLGRLGLGSGSGQSLLASLSVLDILSASAALSNGNHYVQLPLTASVPGLIGIDASLVMGEPPQGGGWFAVGHSGQVVRTAQTRLKVTADILGSGALLGVPVHLPLYLELAHAEAIVGSASCPTPSAPRGSATILARPGAVRAMIGEVDHARFVNFNTQPVVGLARMAEVKLLGIVVLQVLASSLVEIAQTAPVPLTFTSADIAAGKAHTARTTTVVSSLTGSLLGNLQLQVPILGLGLNLTSLTALLGVIISPLVPVLDLTVARLLEALGLGLGEVDVRAYGVRCSHPVLVG